MKQATYQFLALFLAIVLAQFAIDYARELKQKSNEEKK